MQKASFILNYLAVGKFYLKLSCNGQFLSQDILQLSRENNIWKHNRGEVRTFSKCKQNFILSLAPTLSRSRDTCRVKFIYYRVSRCPLWVLLRDHDLSFLGCKVQNEFVAILTTQKSNLSFSINVIESFKFASRESLLKMY